MCPNFWGTELWWWQKSHFTSTNSSKKPQTIPGPSTGCSWPHRLWGPLQWLHRNSGWMTSSQLLKGVWWVQLPLCFLQIDIWNRKTMSDFYSCILIEAEEWAVTPFPSQKCWNLEVSLRRESMLACLVSTWHKLGLSEKRKPQLRKYPY